MCNHQIWYVQAAGQNESGTTQLAALDVEADLSYTGIDCSDSRRLERDEGQQADR